jgi:poly(hydroxyalkanoate) depolymerase family esterase
MSSARTVFAGLSVILGLGAAQVARAASLQQVSNWGGAGLPSDVTMYIYVPTKVATNPPVLTLIHYCGGTASTVFGQAQGGGIVSAADQYGFIMVVPSSGRCWDVESDKAWTRSGGGDSDAIKQMVTYALGKYGGNPDRVYSTGDSSGAMMTELLLALYPDIFKAGSAFAGMPAGCRGSNESGTSMGYSGACAGGNVTHTAQQWGDIARKMDPGYTGHHPRVQLFHGDSDPTINYKNYGEAIKEWTNVLGLDATTPTSTTMNVPLGNHQATRQQWNNACGYLVVDGFTSIGGDHGPSDALFKAQYVIPFLGLDKTGAVDPEIAQCGAGGAGGAGLGGPVGQAGKSGSGGRGGAGFGGGAGGGGGSAGGTGGSPAGSAGAPGEGGSPGTGGLAVGGEGGGTGGLGVQSGAGGNAATGGGPGSGSGGTSSAEGGGSGSSATAGSGGCTCAIQGPDSRQSVELAVLTLGLVLGTRARRRHSRRR